MLPISCWFFFSQQNIPILNCLFWLEFLIRIYALKIWLSFPFFAIENGFEFSFYVLVSCDVWKRILNFISIINNFPLKLGLKSPYGARDISKTPCKVKA